MVTEKAELEQQLMWKKAELTGAKETIKKNQNQMKQIKQVRGSSGIFLIHSMFSSNVGV